MELLTAGVVGAAVASSFAYAIWPLVRPPEDADGLVPGGEDGRETREQEVSRLLLERDQAYKNILDIEFDRQMGKLSEEDFAQMIGAARTRALEILRRLEARGVAEGAVAVQLSEREAAQAAEELVEASSADAEEDEAPAEREQTLDERLEEEILAYRQVKPPQAAPAPPKPKKAPAPSKAAAPAAPLSAGGEASPSVRFCPSCGNRVGEGHNFCAACGSKLR